MFCPFLSLFPFLFSFLSVVLPHGHWRTDTIGSGTFSAHQPASHCPDWWIDQQHIAEPSCNAGIVQTHSTQGGVKVSATTIFSQVVAQFMIQEILALKMIPDLRGHLFLG